jgi:hypothetical protein
MTPRRTVRVTDGTWKIWQLVAAERGSSVSVLIREAVDEFLGRMHLNEILEEPAPVPDPPERDSVGVVMSRELKGRKEGLSLQSCPRAPSHIKGKQCAMCGKVP